jgi:hypothetical protein
LNDFEGEFKNSKEFGSYKTVNKSKALKTEERDLTHLNIWNDLGCVKSLKETYLSPIDSHVD